MYTFLCHNRIDLPTCGALLNQNILCYSMNRFDPMEIEYAPIFLLVVNPCGNTIDQIVKLI